MYNILILGATGLVGQTVYKYLKLKYPQNVWATSRNRSSDLLYLSSETFDSDLKSILDKTRGIDYIINCIGITSENSDIEKLNYTNGVFPNLLEKFAEKNKIKLIHISTDAVFSKSAGRVDEKSKTSPDTNYGRSKLLGETSSRNSITVRTSFLGLDEIGHHGLIERIKHADGIFIGFTNQLWNGCTTLQFAEFCDDTIVNNRFDELRNNSDIFHFAPIEPISKYEIARTFNRVGNLGLIIKKTTGEEISRYLITNYFDLLNLAKYNNKINTALLDL